MNNRVWIALLSLVSIASLITALWSRHGIRSSSSSAPAVVADNGSAEAAKVIERMRLIDAKLTAIASRLDTLEQQRATVPALGSTTALAEVDANLETLVRSASKNAADIQKTSADMASLVKSTQGAFNAVAEQIQKLRGELAKLAEEVRGK